LEIAPAGETGALDRGLTDGAKRRARHRCGSEIVATQSARITRRSSLGPAASHCVQAFGSHAPHTAPTLCATAARTAGRRARRATRPAFPRARPDTPLTRQGIQHLEPLVREPALRPTLDQPALPPVDSARLSADSKRQPSSLLAHRVMKVIANRHSAAKQLSIDRMQLSIDRRSRP
jgi:hypothetical protein